MSAGAEHAAIRDLARRLKALELHAARSGREVARALAQVAADSAAPSAIGLAGELYAAADALVVALPAYAPPRNVLHRLLASAEGVLEAGGDAGQLRAAVLGEAERLAAWAQAAGAQVARVGAALVPEGGVVLTWTLSETVRRALAEAWRQGKRFRVRVTESRPNQDGLETARGLAVLGVPVEVTIDAALPAMTPRASVMLVGTEAIAADGSAICKVGTYPAALAARRRGLRVYVAADTLKFDTGSLLGLSPQREALRFSPGDLTGQRAGGPVRLAGRLFDQTPAALLAGIVTERGLLAPQACAAVMQALPASRWLTGRLARRPIQESLV
ncbi:MAG: hypothetical protein IT318_10320 [Anaerolineales bacterium]|nr:hypothetical protein [Anaerolineales bacterium]